jgi:hypothetical protein
MAKMNGKDVVKKMQMFFSVKKVHGWRLDTSDDIKPDWPSEISIDVILGHEIKMDPHTTTWKLALSLSVSPQIVINHLQYDLKMKCYDLAEITKIRMSVLCSDHAECA